MAAKEKVSGQFAEYMPAVLDLSVIPSTHPFWSHVDNGRDIRITKADGVTAVAREIVSIDKTAHTGQIRLFGKFRPDRDSAFYLHYGNSLLFEPSASSTYGKNGAYDPWQKYAGHLDGLTNSTSLSAVGSVLAGAPTLVAGKIGNGEQFGGSDAIGVASIFGLTESGVTVSFWVNLPTASQKGTLVKVGGASDGFAIGVGSGDLATLGNKLVVVFDGKWTLTNGPTIGTGWHHIVLTLRYYDSGNGVIIARIFLDGQFAATNSYPGNNPLAPTGSASSIGSYPSGANKLSAGIVDELEISNQARPDSYIATLYANQSNNAAWWTGIGPEESGNWAPPVAPAVEYTDAAKRVLAEALRVQAACYKKFYDGTDFWCAAPDYVLMFTADAWYFFTGFRSFVTAAHIKNFYEKIVAAQLGGDFPIAILQTDPALAEYRLWWSGMDLAHHHVTMDSNLMIPQLAKRYYDMTGDITSFASRAAAMATALGRVPVDATSKLVHITVGDEFVDWGFHDVIRPSGDVLMGSLLYWKACTDMAALYTANSDAANAATYSGKANDVAANIGSLWNATDGMFRAANGQNNQIDICGSAYAVFLGVATAPQQTAISNYLVANFDLLSYQGFYRQSDKNWTDVYFIGGEIVNQPGAHDDAFWSVANQWIAEAIKLTSPAKAVQMVEEFSRGTEMSRELWPVGGASGGFSDNLESPMGLTAFIEANPTLFQEP
jgi:hypothetical protein